MATTGPASSRDRATPSAARGDGAASPWASKYRGAVVEDLDPSAAFSVHPATPIHVALVSALERDYDHLTVIDRHKTLLGYMSVPRLRQLLEHGRVQESEPVEKVMQKFRRKGTKYTLITMATALEDLEDFLEGRRAGNGHKSDFAVVTDPGRRFVLGVATMEDLRRFAERRPN